ncbi:MAG: hypothetical protein DRG59_12800, partial [Deltaproteobacteria bacterium]
MKSCGTKIAVSYALMIALILFVSCQSPISESRFLRSLNANSWLEAFEAIDQRINGGHGYANHLDTLGYLSWRQSRIFESYLNIYEATQDLSWLEKFVQQADLILSHRDDHLWGGAPAWSSLKYLKTGWNKPEPLLVNNAMIIYPLARFDALVLNKVTLSAFHNVALWYMSNVSETVDYFQQWYIVDEEAGYYLIQDAEFVNHPGINAPFNWNAAMGRVLLALYDATGRVAYLKQARALAQTLKAGLNVMDNDSYCWHYWFGEGYERYKSTEDVSHGALDVQFALACHEHGIVFDAQDIHRFANTLKKNVWDGQEFTSSVWGTGKINPSIA